MRSRILIAGRDVALRARIARLLTKSGYSAEVAAGAAPSSHTGRRNIALSIVATDSKAEASDLAASLRQETGKTVLIVWVGRLSETVPGAIDASNETELLAQVTSSLVTAETVEAPPALLFADYRFDLAGQSLAKKIGNDIPLTNLEYRLLYEFVQRPGHVLSREYLLQNLSGREAEPFDRSVDMLIMRLRRKIETDPKEPSLIVAVPGRGYKFTGKVKRQTTLVQPDDTLDHSPLPSEQRRQVTVLSAELLPASGHTIPEDPEDLRAVIENFRRHAASICERFSGRVGQQAAQEITMFFGYPSALEDAAERSISAGLALAATFHNDLHVEGALAVKVGISTGLVIVDINEELIGSVLSEARMLKSFAEPGEVIAASSTRNLAGEHFAYRNISPLLLKGGGRAMQAASELGPAGSGSRIDARLEGLATADQIVISASTRRLASDTFELIDLGGQDPKGIAEPVHAWRVEGALVSESRFDANRGGGALTPLVGREEELDLLLRRWSQTTDGEGQVVLLSGEPGIGKSRVLSTLRERLEAQGVRALRFQCSPYYVNSAFWPVIDNFERALQFTSDETEDAKLDRLEALIITQYGRPLTDVRFVASILSIPNDTRYAAQPMTPQKHKDETLRTLVDLTEAVARRYPSVLLFEDLHWADPTTLELLDLLIDRVRAVPLLLVLTHRPEFQSRWSTRGHVGALNLCKLTRTQSAVMVSSLAGGKALPPALLEQILTRTDGVPLFVEELAKSILESGELTEAADHYEFSGSVPAVAIPATLRDSLMARLDRSMPAKEIAQIGAAIGREFSYELIAAVASMPQAQIDDALAQLSESGLAFRRGTPPDALYTFKHALVQDTAYDSLLKSRRHELHGRIARMIEARFPNIKITEPEVLAHHLTAAGLVEDAIPLWQRAGELSMARSAMIEAASHLRKALDLLSVQPDSPESQEQELDLQIALGSVLTSTCGYTDETVGETFARARLLCKKLGQSQQLPLVIFGEWLYHVLRGELVPSLGRAKDLFRAAQNQGDASVEYLSHTVYLRSFWILGAFTEARWHGEQALDIYNPSYRDRLVLLTAEDPQCAALMFYSLLLLCLGYFDKARALIEDALTIARAGHQVHIFTYAAGIACICDTVLCDPATLSKHAEEVLAWSAKYGLPFWEEWGTFFRGHSLALANRPDNGIELMKSGSEAIDMMGMVCYRPFRLALLAEAYGAAGLYSEGLERVDEAIDLIAVTQERWFEAETHRVRAELLRRVGDEAAAQTALSHSLDVARRQQAKSWELRTSTSLARLWQNQGKRQDAHELLAPVYGWFTEGFDTKDLRDAKFLLAELIR